MRVKWQRKMVITDWKTQSNLAVMFVFWSLFLVLVLVGVFFVNYASVAKQTAGLNIHDELVAQMLLVEQSRQLAFFYGAAIFIFVALIGFYVLVYTHRITGPIYKLNKVMDEAIQNKDWPKAPLSFRSGDSFHEMAQKFNQFVDVMKSVQGSDRKLSQSRER